MAEKYFTRFEGDDIIVTRKSDRKTIAFPKADCLDGTDKPSWIVAVMRAKACDEQEWS